MEHTSTVDFGEFRVDLDNEQLCRGPDVIALPPKEFMLLRCLLDRSGQLVSKTQLFTTVWPDTAVVDAVLTVAIGTLRKALGDDPRTPRFIETVHRRGYRFIGKVVSSQHSVASSKEGAGD
jgi:DNA-binding winged helix-turn-helix (wHTH) protein